jgi:hypothetical protein
MALGGVFLVLVFFRGEEGKERESGGAGCVRLQLSPEKGRGRGGFT